MKIYAFGPGEYLGVRQWGVPDFRVANLLRDRTTLEEVREAAAQLLGRTLLWTIPYIERYDHAATLADQA